MLSRTLILSVVLANVAYAQTVTIGSGATERNVGVKVRFSVLGGAINVQSGGSVNFKGATVENLSTLTAAGGAKLLCLHDTIFIDAASYEPGSNKPWLDFSALANGDRANTAFSFNRVTFSTSSTSRNKNVKASSTTPVLRFLGSYGNRWGASYEVDDTSDRIRWHTTTDGSNIVTRTGPAAGEFDTLEEALKASGTVAGSTFTPRSLATLGSDFYLDDFVDWSTLPSNGASTTGPIVQGFYLAPMFGIAVDDSDAGSGNPTDRRGKLINCVVARGAVRETTAENCTYFGPSASAIPVSNVLCKNVIMENAGSGNDTTTYINITNATSAYFINPSTFGLHLVSPGGDNAINHGATLTVTTDIDGELHAGTWDIGADEYNLPAIVTASHPTRDTTPDLDATGLVGYWIAFYRDGTYIGSALVDGTGHAYFSDSTQGNGQSHTYTVGYDYGNGNLGAKISTGPLITVDTEPPAAPSDTWVTCYNTVNDVEWTPSTSTDVVGYRVWRKTGSGGTWAPLNTTNPANKMLPASATKWRDSGLTNGTQYFYKVEAIDGALLH